MWRTFFDAVIMMETKRRLLRLPEVSLALSRS
jgi:predicted DNA-binding transcriptional regulator AlpA